MSQHWRTLPVAQGRETKTRQFAGQPAAQANPPDPKPSQPHESPPDPQPPEEKRSEVGLSKDQRNQKKRAERKMYQGQRRWNQDRPGLGLDERREAMEEWANREAKKHGVRRFWNDDELREWAHRHADYWDDSHRRRSTPRPHTQFDRDQGRRGNVNSAKVRTHTKEARAILCQELRAEGHIPKYLARRFDVHLSTIYRWLALPDLKAWWKGQLSTASGLFGKFLFAKSTNRLTAIFELLNDLDKATEQLECCLFYRCSTQRAANSWRWAKRRARKALESVPTVWNSALICHVAKSTRH